MDFMEEAEAKIEDFRKVDSNENKHKMLFESRGSAGRNNEKLAQILFAFDLAINIIGWQNKPLANLSKFLTSYQASVDAKYHNDFKDVMIAEEIERRRSERKGISILQQ